MDDSVFCSNCGTAITGEATDDPARRKDCPKCGSLGRAFVMNASPGAYTFTGHDVDLTYVSYPEKLLTAAQDLIEKGEFSISVVVAHMACEISVERAISRAFKAKGIDYLEQPVEDLLPSYNLANDRVRNLYNAATGVDIQRNPSGNSLRSRRLVETRRSMRERLRLRQRRRLHSMLRAV